MTVEEVQNRDKKDKKDKIGTKMGNNGEEEENVEERSRQERKIQKNTMMSVGKRWARKSSIALSRLQIIVLTILDMGQRH